MIAEIVARQLGALSAVQAAGIETLLTATAALALTHRAYVLATAWHETAMTMQPICERGPARYFTKYEPGTKPGRSLGNTRAGDGFRYRGRGFVQITGRRNYARASSAVGVDLVALPDTALVPAVAANIIVAGMDEGWFTGKRLSDYGDYVSMRRVVNGTDCAVKIAGYARKFEAALRAIPPAPGTAPMAPRPVAVQPRPAPVSPLPVPPSKSQPAASAARPASLMAFLDAFWLR